MESNVVDKLREALSKILGIADHLLMRYEVPKLAACEISELKQIADAALSAPARQCDVGTPEEQAYRMRLYCKSHGVDESGCFRCERCQFLAVDRCELAWAQMPYEQEGGAE